VLYFILLGFELKALAK